MKLFASNYDGTLCYDKKVMAEDSYAIRKWQEKGNLFAIVTGRSKESLEKYLAKDGLDPDYLVTNNGTMIFDREGSLLESNYLDYVTAIDVMYIAKETPGVASYVVNDGYHRHRVIVNPDINDTRYPTMKQDLSEEAVMDLGEYSQIVISMISPDRADTFADEMNLFFSEGIEAYASNYCVDVVTKGISKGTGLEFVANYVDVDMDDVYVIGNLNKDIPMLSVTENRAAFFTAPDNIKEMCPKEYMSVYEMLNDITDK